jgi:hypothetical protein
MADFRLLPIAQRSVPSLGTRKRQDFLDDCNPGPERHPLRSHRLYCRYCETAWSSICLTVHPVGWEPRKPRFEVPGGWSANGKSVFSPIVRFGGHTRNPQNACPKVLDERDFSPTGAVQLRVVGLVTQNLVLTEAYILLVWRGALDAVDDENLDRIPGRNDPETELLFERALNRGCIGLAGGAATRDTWLAG